jgi:hypothetical protein
MMDVAWHTLRYYRHDPEEPTPIGEGDLYGQVRCKRCGSTVLCIVTEPAPPMMEAWILDWMPHLCGEKAPRKTPPIVSWVIPQPKVPV